MALIVISIILMVSSIWNLRVIYLNRKIEKLKSYVAVLEDRNEQLSNALIDVCSIEFDSSIEHFNEIH